MKSIRGTFGLHAGADAPVFRAMLGEPGTTARDVRAPPRVIRARAAANDGRDPTIPFRVGRVGQWFGPCVRRATLRRQREMADISQIENNYIRYRIYK